MMRSTVSARLCAPGDFRRPPLRFWPAPLRFWLAPVWRVLAGRFLTGLLLAGLSLAGLSLALTGCNINFLEGERLEREKRWEEAANAYHLALIDNPGDDIVKQSFDRVNKVLARENFQRYKVFLAKKSFRKAFHRLVDATRQDPLLAPARVEMTKWERVLVAGQLKLVLESAQSRLALADQVDMIVRINTPNPGKTIDAVVDIETGNFFGEDLLYDRPSDIMVFYSINSVGASMLFGRSRIKKFTSREYRRFIRFRTPILDELKGKIRIDPYQEARPIWSHRKTLPPESWPADGVAPKMNPRYSLKIVGRRILVSSKNQRADFMPRFLYLNKKGRRAFVDFGRYETRYDASRRRWIFRRLSLSESDYFTIFSRNIALQPYFFYRGDVFVFESARKTPGEG